MAKRFLITTEALGTGDDELGRTLTRNFFHSLARTAEKPSAVMFMNSGVRLACEGSEVIDDLRLLADSGVQIAVCGTCLDHLKLTDSLLVGALGTMPMAVEAFLGEDEVVTIG